MYIRLYFVVLIMSVCSLASAQESWPFENEVKSIVAQDTLITNRKDIILFTGSSSIRMWTDVATYFPDKNVLNRGFGGSTMRDMLHYVDKLILPYNPKQIFIYEGDNDLAAKRTHEEILASADSLVNLIQEKISKKVVIAFISPKPSLARWAIKDHYIAFNQKFEAWTKSKKNVKFVNVWTPMLDAGGEVQKDLFVSDGLHMNKKGYDIWAGVIRKHIK